MNTKLFKVMSGVAVCTLLFTGCGKDEEKKDNEKIEQVDKKVEAKTYKDLKLKTYTDYKNDTLSVSVTLDNDANKETPLVFEKDELLHIQVTDDKDAILFEKTVKDENRKSMLAKENLQWDEKFELKDATGKIKVKTTLLLKDSKKVKYDQKMLVSETEFAVQGSVPGETAPAPQPPKGGDGSNASETNTVNNQTANNAKGIIYMPKRTVTYEYATNDEKVNVEKYKFMQDGYVQTENDMTGTNVYYADDSGLYLMYTNPAANVSDNIIPKVKNGQVEVSKTLLVPNQPTVGQKWADNHGSNFEVKGVNASVKASGKTYNDVVKVVKDGNVNYYYSKNDGLLKVESNYGGNTQVMLELKSVR